MGLSLGVGENMHNAYYRVNEKMQNAYFEVSKLNDQPLFPVRLKPSPPRKTPDRQHNGGPHCN
jgi:hypothetical protein